MNKKAFTLVEIIATVAILGMILVVTVPAMMKLIKGNDDKTKEYFGKTLVNSAKAYINDGNEKDMVSCNFLEQEGYIKTCIVDKYNCNKARVTITKDSKTNTYKYDYNLDPCEEKGNN